MKKKPTALVASAPVQPYVMGVADQLSNDPFLRDMFGSRFRVVVDFDTQARRITYSFRAPDDIDADDSGAQVV